MAERILTPRERALARLYTGPLAHLVAGLADWVTLVRRTVLARRSGRR